MNISESLDDKVKPIISAYKKPQSLIKKIYLNARRSNMKKRVIPGEEESCLDKNKVNYNEINIKTFKNRNKVDYKKKYNQK